MARSSWVIWKIPTLSETVTDIIGGEQDPEDQPGVGDTLRINTGGETAEVQWQVRDSATRPWVDVEEGDELTLKVTNDHAGKMLRAKVTYMTQEDDDETTVDESEFPTWVEYTEVLTVSGDIENNFPAATQESYEIEVELAARPPAPAKGDRAAQPAKVEMGSVADLFFDSDSDDVLTYSITAVPALDSAASDGVMGTEDEHDPATGGLVYRTYATEFNTADSETTRVDDLPEQIFSIDKDSGEITYFTGQEQTHDGDAEDGAGNTLAFTISATDNQPGTTPATVGVTVRVNVAPTAINLTDNQAIAADLPVPAKGEMGTALTDGTGDVTFVDDTEYEERKVADLNVMDQNDMDEDSDHGYGTHAVTLSGRGANQFEIRETEDDDEDGSTWEVWLKDDATFNFEGLKTAKETGSSITLVITVTATDGGGLKTQGVFSVEVMNPTAKTEADLEAARKGERSSGCEERKGSGCG